MIQYCAPAVDEMIFKDSMTFHHIPILTESYRVISYPIITISVCRLETDSGRGFDSLHTESSEVFFRIPFASTVKVRRRAEEYAIP